MCFGGGGGQQTVEYYIPYEVPAFAAPGGGYTYEPQYPLASQLYQDRLTQGTGGYGYAGGGTNPNSAAGMLGTRPTTGGQVSNIGSESHMGNVPGASQLLAGMSNQSPVRGWF